MPAGTHTSSGTGTCHGAQAMTSSARTAAAEPGDGPLLQVLRHHDPPRKLRRSGRDGGFSEITISRPK